MMYRRCPREPRRRPREQRGAVVQSGHQPGGDGVELADVTKGELTQERTQRRRGVGPVEQGAHRPVSQQRHVLDAVGPGDHARDQRGHLRPGVGALVGRHAQVHVGQRRQVTLLGQGDHRDRTAQDTRFGRRRLPTRRVEYERVASTRCPSSWPNVIVEKSHSSTTTGHFGSDPPHLQRHRCIQINVRARATGEAAVRTSEGNTGVDVSALPARRTSPLS